MPKGWWCFCHREEEPLFQAVRTGDVSKVRRLVTHSGTNLMLPKKPGWLAIHQAAWYGQDRCLRVLLSGNTHTHTHCFCGAAQPGMINKKTERGETALMVAVGQEQLQCLQVLLENGADPDISNHDKETPLYKGSNSVTCLYFLWSPVQPALFLAACERNNAAMVAALLDRGAAVNTHCILGCTALQEAICQNNVEICDMLLKAGAKHNLTNVYGIAPLFSAAQSGQLAALRFLLKHGGYRRNLTGHSSTTIQSWPCLLHPSFTTTIRSQLKFQSSLSIPHHFFCHVFCGPPPQVQILTVRLLMAPLLCMKQLKMSTKTSWNSSFPKKQMPTSLERQDYYHCMSLPRQGMTCTQSHVL